MSYLYAVQMLIPDYVQPIKIGFSANPSVRMLAYQGEPFPVRWMGSWPVRDRVEEMTVHLRLNNFRMHGEWFFPSGVVLDLINTNLRLPGAVLGEGSDRSPRKNEIQNAQRWNLARLAADGRAVWSEPTENAEFISSVFDRSEVSHSAMKSTWRL